MKVIILGGCGRTGSSAAWDLIKHDEVSQVVLVDKKVDMTNVHESVRQSNKISTLNLDITDHKALVRKIEGNDVVINTVGPYSRFGSAPMRAAIEARVNYVDVCDNCNVTKQIFELDESARKAGVSICTGFGSSPGFTNILAKYAADKLDEVDEIQIFGALGLGKFLDYYGPAALVQAITKFSGTVIQYIDGKLVDVPSGSGAEEFTFAEPIGKLEVYYSQNSEAVTLPRYIPGLKNVVKKVGFLPSWSGKMFMEFINLGFVTEEKLMVDNVPVITNDIMASVIQRASGFWKRVEQYTHSSTNVIVRGKKEGKRTTYIYRPVRSGGSTLAVNMSLCARMLYCGDINVKGVLAPEGAIDPKKLIGELAKTATHFLEEKTVEEEIQF